LHALSDTESEEARALLDPVNESSTTTSGDTPQASAPVDTTHMTLANSGQGARAKDDTAVAMEGEIMSQGEEGEQSRMTGGGAGQHTTGASKEMTQEGPDVALAEEETQIPSVSPHDTLANNLANSGLGARAGDDAAVTMEGEIMSQGEKGEQSRMARGRRGSRAGLHIRSDFPLKFDIRNIYQVCTEEENASALCLLSKFPQPSSSTGRMFAASRSRLRII